MKVIRIVVSALALVPIACFAKGPIGIGKLEVGVSRSAVEGLSPTEGFCRSSGALRIQTFKSSVGRG